MCSVEVERLIRSKPWSAASLGRPMFWWGRLPNNLKPMNALTAEGGQCCDQRCGPADPLGRGTRYPNGSAWL